MRTNLFWDWDLIFLKDGKLLAEGLELCLDGGLVRVKLVPEVEALPKLVQGLGRLAHPEHIDVNFEQLFSYLLNSDFSTTGSTPQ